MPSASQPPDHDNPQAEEQSSALVAPSRDTIVAIATPPGRGGIGVVRLSGPLALSCATPLLRLPTPLEPARVRFCDLVDPATGEKLDEAIATWFAAPRSYTGEDVVEIAAHGSPVLLDFLLRSALTHGARLANPGEFTERAFLSGRLDLTQAEGVRDLIEAQTLFQARIAASQLDGALSRRVLPIKQALIHVIALLEAGIDFAEDDTPVVTAQQLASAIQPIAQGLAALDQSFVQGRLVHSGFTLAIIGEPNVGKSSLFNRLVERERAIVTAVAGTTRDLVTERVSLGGIPIELIDTAGLRFTSEEIERIGIQKTHEALADADLVLLVLDATEALLSPTPQQPATEDSPGRPYSSVSATVFASGSISGPPHAHLLPSAPADETDSLAPVLSSLHDRNVIILLNKSDLLSPSQVPNAEDLHAPSPFDSPLRASLAHSGPKLEPSANSSQLQPDQPTPSNSSAKLTHLAAITSVFSQAPVLLTSAQTGEGIATLRQTIQSQLHTPALTDSGAMLTNLRQHEAVRAAHTSLLSASEAAHHLTPHEMLLLDLYNTLTHLNQLTGETTSDDILNLIFSTFCIGK